MVVVGHDVSLGECFANLMAARAAHVHRDGFQILGSLAETLQEGLDILLGSPFVGMNNSAGLKVGENGHVLVPFHDTELIDSHVADLMQGNVLVGSAQLGFVDLLDDIPARPRVVCDRTDRAETQEVKNRESK